MNIFAAPTQPFAQSQWTACFLFAPDLETKKAQVIDSLELFELVAGAGFEPTTFGL